MNIRYIKLNPADAPAYRAVRLEALLLFPDNYGSDYKEENAKPKLAFEHFIEQQAPGRFIYGAFDGDMLIGICGFAREESEKSRHRGTIIQMYVKQEYSGKGIGLKLLKATIEAAFALAGMEQLVLGVITNNIPAIKTYEKAGFIIFGTQHNYLKLNDGNYLHQHFMKLDNR